jgi:hypothetical protein
VLGSAGFQWPNTPRRRSRQQQILPYSHKDPYRQWRRHPDDGFHREYPFNAYDRFKKPGGNQATHWSEGFQYRSQNQRTDTSAAGGKRRRPKHSQLLLENGADPETRCENGKTPLLRAVPGRHYRAIKALLRHKGVNPDAREASPWGPTPLVLAARYTLVAIAQILLETKGVQPDLEDNDGRTPLSWALETGHLGLAKLLLKHGADINREDRKGKTPMAYAPENISRLKLLGILGLSPDLAGRLVSGESQPPEAAHQGLSICGPDEGDVELGKAA